jgi:hypothetical protein
VIALVERRPPLLCAAAGVGAAAAALPAGCAPDPAALWGLDLGECIGRGGFGEVFRGRWHNTAAAAKARRGWSQGFGRS